MRNAATEDPRGGGRFRRARNVGLALSLGLALAGGVAPAVQAADTVPILGQWRGASFERGNQVVLSVHGVRRVGGATIVYWSLGYPDVNAVSPERSDLTSVTAPNAAVGVADGADQLSNVSILDPASLKAYTPLFAPGASEVVGTGYRGLPLETPPGKAYVAWAALPPLPEGMDKVTLVISGRPFFDVPVEDGLLEPQLADDTAPLVGTGWPTVDTAAISAAGPTDKFILNYTINSKFTDGALARRDSAAADNLDLASDVLFAVDKATLTSKAKSAISKAAGQVKDSGATSITVTGHTDSDADDAYNLKLSKARAEAVAKALKPLLPGTVKITTEGKGEKEPIADNKTADGKAQNRRVTITIPKASK